MSYNTFPALEGLGWPVKCTPRFHTLAGAAPSGASFRTALWAAPLHVIEAPINFLTQTDYQTLKAFYAGQLGGFLPFYFPVTNGSTYLCVFPDSLDYEQFMSELYRLKKLTLNEVR